MAEAQTVNPRLLKAFHRKDQCTLLEQSATWLFY